MKKSSLALCMILLIFSQPWLFARGSEEEKTRYDMGLAGWQAVQIEKNSDLVTQKSTRLIDIFLRNAGKSDMFKMKAWVSDFITPNVELLCSKGMEFTIKSDKPGGNVNAFFTGLAAAETFSLVRTSLSPFQPVWDHLICTIEIKSASSALPVLQRSRENVYAFYAYLNQPIAGFESSDAQVDIAVMQALKKMYADLFPGEIAPIKKGRVYVCEYYVVNYDATNVVFRCLFAVEFY